MISLISSNSSCSSGGGRPRLCKEMLHTCCNVRSGDTRSLAHGRHRKPSFGNESERNRCFGVGFHAELSRLGA